MNSVGTCIEESGRESPAGSSRQVKILDDANVDASDLERARSVSMVASQLGVRFVAQLNESVPELGDKPEIWCVKMAKVRRDGNSVGIPVWNELKTVVMAVEFGDACEEIVFVHLRANRRVVCSRVAAHFGAERARKLEKRELELHGWRLGCVNPFTSLDHKQVFDVDLGRRYSHRGEVWTNFGCLFASIRLEPLVLINKFESRNLGTTALVTSGPSPILERIDRMLNAELFIILGNPPFLVGNYLDLWLEVQHRAVRSTKEVHLEVPGEPRLDLRPLKPDGDQWFLTKHVRISHRGGPVNQIDNPRYREEIARHDLAFVESCVSQVDSGAGTGGKGLPVLDVPDPSCAAVLGDNYKTSVEGRMLFVSILESVERMLEAILDPEEPHDILVSDQVRAARRLWRRKVRLKVFVLAGKTTLSKGGEARRRLEGKLGDKITFIYPDRHVGVLQDALEDLKNTKSGSKPGSAIKNSVESVIFDPAYGVDGQTLILRLAGEFRCLRQEKDGSRYPRGMVFLDCLDAHVHRQLNLILSGEYCQAIDVPQGSN